MEQRENVVGTACSGIGGIFLGILIGAVVGSALTLLFTPQNGSHTREIIRNRYGRIREAIRRNGRKTFKTAHEIAEQTGPFSGE